MYVKIWASSQIFRQVFQCSQSNRWAGCSHRNLHIDFFKAFKIGMYLQRKGWCQWGQTEIEIKHFTLVCYGKRNSHWLCWLAGWSWSSLGPVPKSKWFSTFSEVTLFLYAERFINKSFILLKISLSVGHHPAEQDSNQTPGVSVSWGEMEGSLPLVWGYLVVAIRDL